MADLDPCAPLCLCGARGCRLADLHAQAFVTTGGRGRKGTKIRHRSRRKR